MMALLLAESYLIQKNEVKYDNLNNITSLIISIYNPNNLYIL